MEDDDEWQMVGGIGYCVFLELIDSYDEVRNPERVEFCRVTTAGRAT